MPVEYPILAHGAAKPIDMNIESDQYFIGQIQLSPNGYVHYRNRTDTPKHIKQCQEWQL